MRIGTLIAAAFVAIASVLGGPSAFGQEETADAGQSENPAAWAESPLSFRLTVYLWTASISGDVGVGRLPPAEIDVDFDEIFKNLDWFPPPIMLAGEARYDRFALLSDLIYLGIESDGISRDPLPLTADAELNALILTVGGSYRVVQSNSVNLELLAGARIWMLDTNLTVSGPLATRQAGRSASWIDPIVGIAGQVKLGAGFSIKAEGDVGGFGIGADLDWQVLGALQYQLNKLISLEAGYRYLSVDYDSGSVLYDIALQGPIIGASIRF